VRRRDFLGGAIVSSLASIPTAAEAASSCRYNTDSRAFEDFVLWEDFSEPFHGRSPQVFRLGSGPPVIILHEISGANPQLFAFAKRVASAGFTSIVPILFGRPNQPESNCSVAEQFLRMCVTREFSLFSAHRSSPIVDWVRALGRFVYAGISPRGIGVVGLCVTGNFALAMAADEYLLAPVISEPALPFSVPWHPGNKSSLGLTGDEIASLQRRIRGGMQVAAFRFTDDPFVSVDRMKALEALVTDARGKLVGNYSIPPICPNAHAVFTDHFDESSATSQSVFSQLVDFLRQSLPSI